jgi:hypothetical protein
MPETSARESRAHPNRIQGVTVLALPPNVPRFLLQL